MEETTKIKDLTPESRRVNVLAKVVSIGEPKQIQTRFGEEKSVTEVYIGDDTGKIILSLWGEQAGQASEHLQKETLQQRWRRRRKRRPALPKEKV